MIFFNYVFIVEINELCIDDMGAFNLFQFDFYGKFIQFNMAVRADDNNIIITILALLSQWLNMMSFTIKFIFRQENLCSANLTTIIFFSLEPFYGHRISVISSDPNMVFTITRISSFI